MALRLGDNVWCSESVQDSKEVTEGFSPACLPSKSTIFPVP
jgi:hypothetical protein